MSESAQPSIDNAVPEPQADGFWARTWRLTGILAGLIVALPMVMVFGMLRGLRWLARMQPVLARFAWRLAGSPLPARLLALGGMVAALTLALVALGLAGSARLGRLANVAGGLFVVGSVCFSGSLYLLTLAGTKGIGLVTPLGGVMLIAGWLVLAGAALKVAPGRG